MATADVTRTQHSPPEKIVPRRSRIARRAVSSAIIVFLCLGFVVWNLPWLANHDNFALPTTHGLPFRLHAEGRTWLNQSTCAEARWCSGELKCLSQDEMMAQNHWPLAQVGAILTLFGAAHPIWRAASDGRYPSMLFVSSGHGCYVPYWLSGGW